MPFVSHVLRIKDFCENAKEPFFPKVNLLEVTLDKAKRSIVSTLTASLPLEPDHLSRAEMALRAKSAFTSSDRKSLFDSALAAFIARERQVFRSAVEHKNSRPVKTVEWVQAHEIHLKLPEKSDLEKIETQFKKLKGVRFNVV